MGLLGESWDRPGRGRSVFLYLSFLTLILLVVNASNWFILSRVTESVDEELGLRLSTVASAVVTKAIPDLLLRPGVEDDKFVRKKFKESVRDYDLEDVFLLDPDGVVLLRQRGEETGAQYEFLDLDRDAFAQAAAGVPSASPALEIDGVVLRTGYAPVENEDGEVEAVLGVTAGGNLYARVPALRRTFFRVSVGSAALVLLFGAIFFGMSRRLARTESALVRAETLSAMGMMAAGVAHEVRNPLAIIAGTATRLKKKYASAAADPLFDFIPEEIERLNGIVEGYLRFARDEPMAFADCDLRAVVDRSARLVEEEFAQRDVRVRTALGERAVSIRGDPHRIEQVLLNLLLNASQAMPGGGELDLELRSDGRRAAVEVADRGPGFGEKERKGAFQPFFTTKEKGSGLGLAMAKRIVEAHGGTIRIANRPGGGARVTVELPLASPAGPAEES